MRRVLLVRCLHCGLQRTSVCGEQVCGWYGYRLDAKLIFTNQRNSLCLGNFKSGDVGVDTSNFA